MDFSHDEISGGSHHSFVGFSFLGFRDITLEGCLPDHWGKYLCCFLHGSEIKANFINI